MFNIGDLAITSLEKITAFEVNNGDYICTMDELQDASLANSEEKQDIVGKQGRKITSLKKNKSVTVSGTSGMISGPLLAKQVGSEFEEGTFTVRCTDYTTVSGGKAKTEFKAAGSVGAEIHELYIRNSDGTLGKKLTQSAEVAVGVYKYDPSTCTLEFHTDVINGTEIAVIYDRQVKGARLQNLSDKYSGKATLYIDCFAEDKCANVYYVQIKIPKADFSGEFSLEMGDSQTMHNFEAEALAGACGSNGALWEYTVFGADQAEDTIE